MPILASFVLPHPPLAIPEIGKGKESVIAKTVASLEEAGKRIAALKPETIIFISPHAESYSDYFQIGDGEVVMGSFAEYKAPNVNFRLFYDRPLIEAIAALSKIAFFPAGTEGGEELYLDHGTMVPLYFINKHYRDFKAVRLGLSGLSLSEHYRFGQIIQEAVNKLNERVVVVASGDLSHVIKKEGPYGYHPSGPSYDKQVMKILSEANFGELLSFNRATLSEAEECGHRAFCLMAGILDRLSVRPLRLSYEDGTGIGYGALSYSVLGDNPSRAFLELYRSKQSFMVKREIENSDIYAKLARMAIERYVTSGTKLTLGNDWPKVFFTKKSGVFVTINKDGDIRGCMGSIRPMTASLGNEIIASAITAASLDDRFPKIRKDELPFLSIAVDILSSPIPILSITDLDPKIYGVVVEYGEKRGALLPNIPGIDTPEEQVLTAMYKARIPEKEDVALYRFSVIHHV